MSDVLILFSTEWMLLIGHWIWKKMGGNNEVTSLITLMLAGFAGLMVMWKVIADAI